MKKLEIDSGDLKFFAAAALTGLLANPVNMTSERQKFLNLKGITLEKLAAVSALQLMEELKMLETAMGKDAVQKEEKIEEI